jgi:hypothetical protein
MVSPSLGIGFDFCRMRAALPGAVFYWTVDTSARDPPTIHSTPLICR